MPHATFFNLPEAKRELIVNHAVEEFYQAGYEKASISKIVERSKIAKGSFYQYFENKDDLYLYLIERIHRQKREAAALVYQDPEGTDFVEFLRRLFLSGISFFLEHPKYAAIANEFMTLPKEVNGTFLSAGLNESHRYLAELIERKKARGEIGSGIDSDTLARMTTFFSMHFADFFMKHYASGAEEDRYVREVDHMLRIIERGIR
ncbi:TetR/AcrR family transcriptional regulator [Paenibacillus flagellatus]|uniref:HTH tetR-type domain-containing protein n=1 Tax=Paenibacillus flagellatus TaxID=2211139 RepID=A0A2V5KBM0_9BACL|nr:TetR/AcrR family transcriptional regulator [Paenibacillus flagellatus]PYI56959.1 hypothetical protein DLM86_00475 [Paenibacillus flagellatus]